MSQQPSRQTERARSRMGQDKTPTTDSSEESSENLFSTPRKHPDEEGYASRSGTSPPPTNPPSYFDLGQPGYRTPLPQTRTPLPRAPRFGPRPQLRVQRPSFTPLFETRRKNVSRSRGRHVQRGLSHQALQLGNNSDETDVGKLGPGHLTGSCGTLQSDVQGHKPALQAGRPPLSFGPPITSHQPSEFSGPISTASDLAATQYRGHTRASRTTSTWCPEFVPRRASHPAPQDQQVPDGHLTQDDAIYKDRSSSVRGQYEPPAHPPQTKPGISSNLSDVKKASKRPRLGDSSPTDQPASQRPRTLVTEPPCATQHPPRGAGGPPLPQPRASSAPSASFSNATMRRRTGVAASSTPEPAIRTSPPGNADANPPRPSNVTPPNPRQSMSTPRPNTIDSSLRQASLTTPQRPSPSTTASLSIGRETDLRRSSASTPPGRRPSSTASASPTARNPTSARNLSPSTRPSSRPNSYRNALNDRRLNTPATSGSQPSAISQACNTGRGTSHVWDEGFDFWSLTPHQRTTYHNLNAYLITNLRSRPQGQGGIPNPGPSRAYRENNPEDPRIERTMYGLQVTREEAIGIIMGQEEVRKQAEDKRRIAAETQAADATVAQASQNEHATTQKRPRTEQRFREEMARLRLPLLPSNDHQDGHRRVASQPPPASHRTERHRPRSTTIAGHNQRVTNGDYDENDEHSKNKKGRKREERHYRCLLPADPQTPFQHHHYPLDFLTKPPKSLLPPSTYSRLDNTSSLSHKSLSSKNSYSHMHRKAGFRTISQYDELCKSLQQDIKRILSSAAPHLDSSLAVSADYCPICHASDTLAERSQRATKSVSEGKYARVVALSLLLSLVAGLALVSGCLGSSVAAAVVLAVFILLLLLL